MVFIEFDSIILYLFAHITEEEIFFVVIANQHLLHWLRINGTKNVILQTEKAGFFLILAIFTQ